MIIIPLLGWGEVALISVTSDLNVPHPCGLGSPVVHCFQRKGGGGGVFLLEVQYSVLKSLISTCVLSYVGSREDWLLDRICESKKDCWDSIRRTSYPYQ